MQKDKKKRKFSSFKLKDSLLWLQIQQLNDWQIDAAPVEPTAFFHERLQRLSVFDLVASERAKELLIDAFCEEALLQHPTLKLWKAAPLDTDKLAGVVDYVLAVQRAYLDIPLLCVVEAKKDDFEQGLAQCLVEMYACQWNNQKANRAIDVYGIVTNGDVWRFYRFTQQNQIYASLDYTRREPETLLGVLGYIFQRCEEQASS